MTKITLISSNKIFEGFQNIYSHDSKELKCQMKFAIYLPPNYAADGGDKLPVLYWLSGLTCDENNFIQKAGAQKYAAEHGIIIVCPDTSPRNVDIPGQDDSYDFGSGAGFYINATADLWRDHYQMFSYVTSELISVISHNFAINTERQGIFGHSMGGHGALVCALRNPGLYKSVSAFAPIANPSNCAWGKKAFTGYLGENEENWKEWDATELVKKYNGPPLTLLIHQGGDDKFLAEKQLLPENLLDACKSSNFPIIYEKKVKYDHSYFFIATFIGAHIEHHAKLLKA